MALVTNDDVKFFLNMEEDIHDARITDLITRVEVDFKDYIGGVDFDGVSDYTEYTEVYDGDGTATLYVKKRPLRSVTTIHINTDTPRVYNQASNLVSSDNILVYSAEGKIILDGSVFTLGNRSVQVVYTAGYNKSDAPADFKQIIINEVVALMLEGVGGVNVVENEGFFYKPDKLRKTAKMLKQKYKDYGDF